MREIERLCVESYRQHKHLKTVGEELGIPWQTVYVHLKAVGEPVTGDKTRYGSDKDKLAAASERHFVSLVPQAEDQNSKQFQSKVDFLVNGWRVDVKASSYRPKQKRWAFSLKVQESVTDFFVCFAYDESGSRSKHCLLIPSEIGRRYQTMSLNGTGTGKWWAYEVSQNSLADFFNGIGGLLMYIQDLGETEKLRWLVIDDKGKAVAQFKEYQRANAYVMQVNKAIRKMSGHSAQMH